LLTIRQLCGRGLSPFDLDLADGECVVIRGPSGAGKTILLRAIADLDPNEGRISLDGMDRDDFAAPQWRRKVGYLAAEPSWWAARAIDHLADRDAAEALLFDLDLPSSILDQPLSYLSTGERQRLAIVRALLLAPRVALLDEPTSGLDSDATMKVESILLKRLAEGTSILLVTHALDQAARMAQRCFIIEKGHVREDVS